MSVQDEERKVKLVERPWLECPKTGVRNEHELENSVPHTSDGVFQAAYRVTGNAADAEDVLQTVFLRLARRAEDDATEVEQPQELSLSRGG